MIALHCITSGWVRLAALGGWKEKEEHILYYPPRNSDSSVRLPLPLPLFAGVWCWCWCCVVHVGTWHAVTGDDAHQAGRSGFGIGFGRGVLGTNERVRDYDGVCDADKSYTVLFRRE